LQTQLDSVSLHNKNNSDVYLGLSTVTAGSVATPSHEESIQEPQSFDYSSSFAFPSKEVVSIMSRRVSRGGFHSTDVVKQGFDANGSAET